MFSMTGKPLRIVTFASSGTWAKKDDVGSVLVKVVGGGGAGGNGGGLGGSGGGYSEKLIQGNLLSNNIAVTVGGAGGTSSFGTHCQATGGGSAGGTPGIGINGDINLRGERGRVGATSGIENRVGGDGGGSPFLGGGGQGSTGTGENGVANTGGGGGAGGWVDFNSRPGGAGGSGVVIVYEFAK